MGKFSSSNSPKSGKKWWIVALAIVFIFAIKFFDELSVKILDVYFFLTKPAQIVSEISKNVNNAQDHLKVIEELKTKNITLLHNVNTLKYLEFENKKLLTLLGIKKIKGYEFLGAKVTVNIDYEKKDNFIFINKGKDCNMKEGSAVINSDGLIGRITQVGNNWSRVMLIQNLQSRIPVLMVNSDVEALISGDSKDAIVEIISENKKLSENDKVVTSGTGELFPKGIVVGEYKNNKVVSYVNYNNLDYVIVVLENQNADSSDIFVKDSSLRRIANKYLPSLFPLNNDVIKKNNSDTVQSDVKINVGEKNPAGNNVSLTSKVSSEKKISDNKKEVSSAKKLVEVKKPDVSREKEKTQSDQVSNKPIKNSSAPKTYTIEKNQIL